MCLLVAKRTNKKQMSEFNYLAHKMHNTMTAEEKKKMSSTKICHRRMVKLAIKENRVDAILFVVLGREPSLTQLPPSHTLVTYG